MNVKQVVVAASASTLVVVSVGCLTLEAPQLSAGLPQQDGGIAAECVLVDPSQEPANPSPAPSEPATPNTASLLPTVPPPISVNFTDPADRALLIEDGLEYAVSKGTFAIYRVTSASPRLYLPGSIPGTARTMHHTAMCVGQLYFTNDASGPYSSVQLRGTVDGADKLLEDTGLGRGEFGSCAGPIDIRGATDGDDHIEDLYLTIEPAPTIGSLVPLMMAAIAPIGFVEEPPHMDDNIRISCNELGGCTWRQGITGTCPEPPDPSDPPGDDEPPTPPEPPEGEDPPSGDEPPNAVDPPTPADPPACPPGYEPAEPSQPPPSEPAGVSEPS